VGVTVGVWTGRSGASPGKSQVVRTFWYRA
jgi:hypothetical protein